MMERGLHVDHTTIFRWVQQYAPEMEKRCRPHLRATNDSRAGSMRTSIKIKKVWMYLYRVVDFDGQTLEFLLSPTRDAEAAKRFFVKALQSSACSTASPELENEQMRKKAEFSSLTSAPRVINTDKNAAYPKAEAFLKTIGILPKSVELTTA